MKNENVLCIPINEMKAHFDMSQTSWHVNIEEINSLKHKYLFRPEAEKDFSHKQLIPYAIVMNKDGKVLCYQRAGSEKRLSGIWSAGIGGHVNDKDTKNTVYETLMAGLIREFEEEIGVMLSPGHFEMVGMINEEETEVGHCHTGVVMKVVLEESDLKFDSEISNPTWMDTDELDFNKFELWSALAIKLVSQKKKIHITLVGGQPAPVYHGIVATNPDKVVYIYSSSSKKAVSALKKELSYPSEDVKLDPTDPQKILGAAVKLAKKYSKNEVTVNISGGLKSWSHFFGVVFDAQPNAAVVYMDQNNVLWNYKTMTSSSNFKFDMHTLFRLYGNSLDKNYRKFEDYTQEDFDAIPVIESIRLFNVREFNSLTAVLTKEQQNILKSHKFGRFNSMNSDSFVEWEKSSKEQIGFVRICLFSKNGNFREVVIESEHIVDIVFNSGWFELKVAQILSRWDKAQEICMNCRFPFKTGLDKNETDIIVNTGTKIMFFECKTQIAHTTDIDKFRSVVKSYGGSGSKGVFITDANMTDMARQKCEENELLSFSLKDPSLAMNPEDALYQLLDNELLNINTK